MPYKTGAWGEQAKKRSKKRTKYFAEHHRIWRKNHHLEENFKDRARQRIHYAVKTNKIKKLSCLVCKSSKSEAHHFNYNEPLNVVWLCHRCHLKLHRKEITLEKTEVKKNI